MLDIKLEAAKRSFFNRDRVIQAMDEVDHKKLSKLGAFVRQTARQLIRKPPKKAKPRPGRPPYNQTGKLKGAIIFVYERNRHTVVVGPYRFNSTVQNRTAPNVLEFGGTVTRKGKTFIYDAFPFMRPALEKEKAKKITSQYQNSMRRG